jgi:Uma2 family endonuclease
MAMQTVTKLLTAQEFWLLPETEGKRELVRGEVKTEMSGALHGDIALGIGTVLRQWAKAGNHGYTGVEAGYLLAQNPDFVRLPDVSFVSAERIPEGGIPEAFWTLAPDLAIEVVSPSEKADDIQEKVFDYLLAGTFLVWVVYPRTQQVVVHTPDGIARTLKGTDRLEFEVLPGFSCTVRELLEI